MGRLRNSIDFGIDYAVARNLASDYPVYDAANSTEAATGGGSELVDEFTEREEMILSWTGRAAAIISLTSAAYMCVVAWKRRHKNVFHRLMLALSIHILLWAPWRIYGPAAVPVGTPDVYNAHGTTETCTAQGFFFQLSGQCIPLYYAFLSVYSWCVIVHGNFDPTKYSWIEPYIHVAVHVFPICTAFYLLAIEAYNPSGMVCWVSSIPFGCGDDTGIPCTRGPQNLTPVVWLAGAPVVFSVIFPTIVMLTLIAKVCMMHSHSINSRKKKEEAARAARVTAATAAVTSSSRTSSKRKMFNKAKTQTTLGSSDCLEEDFDDILAIDNNSDDDDDYDEDFVTTTRKKRAAARGQRPVPTSSRRLYGMTPSIVIRQSVVYLGVAYLIWIPQIAYFALSTVSNKKHFGAAVLQSIVSLSKGLWIALVYWYFSFFGSSGAILKLRSSLKRMSSKSRKSMSEALAITQVTQNVQTETEDVTGGGELSAAFSGKSSIEDTTGSLPNNKHKHKRRRSSSKKRHTCAGGGRKYSFNIFDGTNVAGASTGPFSDFIFDGDSDDAANDEAESNYWAGCQNLH